MPQPVAPRVDCNAGPAETLPPIPPLVEMDVWAVAVMGIYQREVGKRHAEHQCIAHLRTQGVIQ